MEFPKSPKQKFLTPEIFPPHLTLERSEKPYLSELISPKKNYQIFMLSLTDESRETKSESKEKLSQVQNTILSLLTFESKACNFFEDE